MLYDYQVKANEKIKELFKIVDKICFAASCGAGKNYMAIGYIDDYLQENPETKVLVLTHGQVILRSQFESACSQFESACYKLSPNFKKATVVKSSDMAKYYDNHNVIISIPQSLKKLGKTIPHFDLVIIDEGHQFYFADGGMVEKIIKNSGAKKQLALTGTPSPYVRNKWPIIAIPMNTLFPNYIEDVIVELAASSYLVKFDDYDLSNGEIKEDKQEGVLTGQATSETLNSLLDFVYKRCKMIWGKHPSVANVFMKSVPDWIVAFKALKKTLIACRSQNQARYVQEYFNKKGVQTLISISDDQDATGAQESFEQFKHSKVPVLIVVGRGVLGFNYPDLANVIDMTCSTNIDRVFQLMSRLVRKPKADVKQKLFLKIVPDLFQNHKGQDYFHHVMTAVLCLTDEYWFTKYNGKNFLQLKMPKTAPRSDDKGSHKKLEHGFFSKKNRPVAECWLGLPSIEFFRGLWHKDGSGSYSYEFTTLGMVREEFLGINNKMGEDESVLMCQRCIEWVNKNKKQPSKKSKNHIEKELGSWLYHKKKDKKLGKFEK